MGARLAEMARLRLQYDEARRTVQDIQQVKKGRERGTCLQASRNIRG